MAKAVTRKATPKPTPAKTPKPARTPTLLDNKLLAALPAQAKECLFPHMKLVALPLGKVLYESGDALHSVYFPTDSIVSLLSVMESGASAEISVVGNEGVIGIEVFMGGESTPAGLSFRAQVPHSPCHRNGSGTSSTGLPLCAC